MCHVLFRAACAGRLPKELGALSNLTHIFLRRNKLTGEEIAERDDVVLEVSPALLLQEQCPSRA